MNKMMEKAVDHVAAILKSLECAVCLEPLKTPVATGCGHFFCRFCITKVLQSSYRSPCPLCKRSFTRRSIQDAPQRDSVILAAKKLAEACEKAAGVTLLSKGNAQKPATARTTTEKEALPEQETGRKSLSRKRKSNENGVLSETSKEKSQVNVPKSKSSLTKSCDDYSNDEVIPSTNKRHCPSVEEKDSEELPSLEELFRIKTEKRLSDSSDSKSKSCENTPSKTLDPIVVAKGLSEPFDIHNAEYKAQVDVDNLKKMHSSETKSKEDKVSKNVSAPQQEKLENVLQINRKTHMSMKKSKVTKLQRSKSGQVALRNKTNQISLDQSAKGGRKVLRKAKSENTADAGELVKENKKTEDIRLFLSPVRVETRKTRQKKSLGSPSKQGKGKRELMKNNDETGDNQAACSSSEEESLSKKIKEAEDFPLTMSRTTVPCSITTNEAGSDKECLIIDETALPIANDANVELVAKPVEVLKSDYLADTAVSVQPVLSPANDRFDLGSKSPGWSRVKQDGKDFKMKTFSRLHVEKNSSSLLTEVDSESPDCHSRESSKETSKSSEAAGKRDSNAEGNKDNKLDDIQEQVVNIESRTTAEDGIYEVDMVPEGENVANDKDEYGSIHKSQNDKDNTSNCVNEKNCEVENVIESTEKRETIPDHPHVNLQKTSQHCEQTDNCIDNSMQICEDNAMDIVENETSNDRPAKPTLICPNIDLTNKNDPPLMHTEEFNYPSTQDFISTQLAPVVAPTTLHSMSGSVQTAEFNTFNSHEMGNIANDEDCSPFDATQLSCHTRTSSEKVNVENGSDIVNSQGNVNNACEKSANKIVGNKNLGEEVLVETRVSEETTPKMPSLIKERRMLSKISKVSKCQKAGSVINHDEDLYLVEHSQQTSQCLLKYYNPNDEMNQVLAPNAHRNFAPRGDNTFSNQLAQYGEFLKKAGDWCGPVERFNMGKSSENTEKTKVIKRTCLTLDEIQEHFVKNNLSGKPEVICSMPFLSGEFKLHVSVSEETLNISVLKVLEPNLKPTSAKSATLQQSEKFFQASNFTSPLPSPIQVLPSSNVESESSQPESISNSSVNKANNLFPYLNKYFSDSEPSENLVAEDQGEQMNDSEVFPVSTEVTKLKNSKAEIVMPLDVEKELLTDFEKELTADVEKELAIDVEKGLATDVEKELAIDVEKELTTDVEKELTTGVEKELPIDVEKELPTDVGKDDSWITFDEEKDETSMHLNAEDNNGPLLVGEAIPDVNNLPATQPHILEKQSSIAEKGGNEISRKDSSDDSLPMPVLMKQVLSQETTEQPQIPVEESCGNMEEEDSAALLFNKMMMKSSSAESGRNSTSKASIYSRHAQLLHQSDVEFSSDPDMTYAKDLVEPLLNIAQNSQTDKNKDVENRWSQRKKNVSPPKQVKPKRSVQEFEELILNKSKDVQNSFSTPKASRLSLKSKKGGKSFKRIQRCVESDSESDVSEESREETSVKKTPPEKKLKISPKKSPTLEKSVQNDIGPDGGSFNSLNSEDSTNVNSTEMFMELQDLDSKILSVVEKLKEYGKDDILESQIVKNALKKRKTQKSSKKEEILLTSSDSDDSTDSFSQTVPPTPPLVHL